MELRPLAVRAPSPNHWTTREFPLALLFENRNCLTSGYRTMSYHHKEINSKCRDLHFADFLEALSVEMYPAHPLGRQLRVAGLTRALQSDFFEDLRSQWEEKGSQSCFQNNNSQKELLFLSVSDKDHWYKNQCMVEVGLG